MRLSPPASLRVVLSVLLASEPLFAAGAPDASRFKAAYAAAVAESAKTFVSAAEVDPEGAVSELAPLAQSEADKALLEKYQGLLKEVAALRQPVAAAAGPAPEGQEPDILDARYKGRLMALAAKLGADGREAADVRRDLLRRAPPVGPDGKPAANAQAPTEQDQAAIRRMEARAGRDGSAVTMRSARRIAAAFDRFAAPENLPAGAAPAPSGARREPADAREAELVGVAKEAFKGGPTTLATHAPAAPHAPDAAHPPAEKGWWTRFRDATTIDSLQHAFEKHNKEGMAAARVTEDKAAAAFAKGEYLSGVGNSVKAWGQRLKAGDTDTVFQAAVGGAALAVVAVVASPVVLPALGLTALASTSTAAGTAVTAGLAALTTFSVVNGVGHFAHKPDLVNGALLAANAVAIPGLGKASEFIVGKTAGLAAGTKAAEATGAAALTAALPEAALAGGTAARVGTAATGGAAATGNAVEAAAAVESSVVQVASRVAPSAEHLAVRAVEGAAHNGLHTTVEKAAAVDSHH